MDTIDWRAFPPRLIAALMFFTRLPLPDALARRAAAHEGLDRAAPVVGLAGLVIGLIVALVWWIASGLFPAPVAAGIAIGAGFLLTGGLHEDGLADTADGLGAGKDRERTLEIMRDSRIGTFGAAALVFSLALRWAALASLSVGAGMLALMIAHGAARSAIALALRHSSYARKEGTGSLVAAGNSDAEFAAALGVGAAIAVILGGFTGLAAAGIGLGAAAIVLAVSHRRLSGYTGDTLGAMEQAAEIAILVALAGFWSLA